MPFITLFKDLGEAKNRILPGKMFTVRVNPLPFRICIVRHEEKWYAFSDMCPHKKASFAQGGWVTKQGGVVCSLHEYIFDMATGQEITNNGCADLDTFPVRATAEGGLEVNLPVWR